VDIADNGSTIASAIGNTQVTVTEADSITDASQALTPTVAEGTALTGQEVAQFTDTYSGGDRTTDLVATIHWGDNSTSTGTITFDGTNYHVAGDHTYAEESPVGSPFVVTVDIADNGSTIASAIGNTLVTVTDADSITDASQALTPTVAEGTPLTGQEVAQFTDTYSGGDRTTDLVATIHWGDNSTSTGTITFDGTNYHVAGDHTYVEESAVGSPFVVTVDIADNGSTIKSGIGNTLVTVTEADTVNPTAGATFSYTVTAGVDTGGLVVGQFTDTYTGGNRTTDLTATIHWGDGSTGVGTITFDGTNYSVTSQAGHSYANNSGSPYTVTVDIVDNGVTLTTLSQTTITVP
jgi:hypothetical protein